MKTYIGTKIIKAKPMDRHTFLRTIKNEEAPENEENAPGYLVQYPPDGYRSWSPQHVFEAAYRELSYGEQDLLGLLQVRDSGKTGKSGETT